MDASPESLAALRQLIETGPHPEDLPSIEIHWRGGRPAQMVPSMGLVPAALGLIPGLLGFIAHHTPAVAARAADACLAVAESAIGSPAPYLSPERW